MGKKNIKLKIQKPLKHATGEAIQGLKNSFGFYYSIYTFTPRLTYF